MIIASQELLILKLEQELQQSHMDCMGPGINYPGVNPVVSLDIYNMAVRSELVYSCLHVYQQYEPEKLDKCQSRINSALA